MKIAATDTVESRLTTTMQESVACARRVDHIAAPTSSGESDADARYIGYPSAVPARAECEDDVREVVRHQAEHPWIGIAGRGKPVDKHYGRRGITGCNRGLRKTLNTPRCLRHHDATGVLSFEHVGQAFGRIRRIEWHVSATGLQHCQNSDDQDRGLPVEA